MWRIVATPLVQRGKLPRRRNCTRRCNGFAATTSTCTTARSLFPTAEIDHLAVTPFGIFVFETKNWSSHIAPSTCSGSLTCTAPNGQQEDRRCSTDQNRSKIRFLQDQLPRIGPVVGAGIFASSNSTLDLRLHADLLSLDDIPHWLRAKRDAFGPSKPVDVFKTTAALLEHADGSSAALSAHKLRVARVP